MSQFPEVRTVNQNLMKRTMKRIPENNINKFLTGKKQDIHSNYKEEFTALYNSGLSHLVKDEFDRVFLSIHQGEYDDYKTFFHAGGIYNIFYLWMRNGFKESPQELAQKLEGLLSK